MFSIYWFKFLFGQHLGYSNLKKSILQNDSKSALVKSGGQERFKKDVLVGDKVVKVVPVVLVLVLIVVDSSVNSVSSGVASF